MAAVAVTIPGLMYLRSATTPKPGHHPFGYVPYVNAPLAQNVPVGEPKGEARVEVKGEASAEPSAEATGESRAESNTVSSAGSGAEFNAGSGVVSTPMPAREKFEAAVERTRSADSEATGSSGSQAAMGEHSEHGETAQMEPPQENVS